MRAALLSSYRSPLELVDRPVPEPQRAVDVVVRVGGAGVCATDLHSIDGWMAHAGVQLPRVLGHENAGWVAAVGDGVSTVAVGDPVVVYPAYSCGLCLACRRGDDMRCASGQFTGLSADGGFADYVRTTERSLVKLPAGVDPADVAPHADAGITAYHAVRKVCHLARPGSVSVVVGIGGLGHIGLQLLRELGSGVIVAIDPNERCRDLAAELGADHVAGAGQIAESARDLTGGRGADLVIDFVGSDETHSDSLAALARGGTYSIVGYGGTLNAPSISLVVNERTVVGNLVGTWPDLYELLELHSAGKVVLRTERHRLEEVNEVLEALRQGQVFGRAVLVPG
ncbi:MAG: alcohol dehydrogenase catalytic domain-containing protein [Acidimicrobiales bacterium]